MNNVKLRSHNSDKTSLADPPADATQAHGHARAGTVTSERQAVSQNRGRRAAGPGRAAPALLANLALIGHCQAAAARPRAGRAGGPAMP